MRAVPASPCRCHRTRCATPTPRPRRSTPTWRASGSSNCMRSTTRAADAAILCCDVGTRNDFPVLEDQRSRGVHYHGLCSVTRRDYHQVRFATLAEPIVFEVQYLCTVVSCTVQRKFNILIFSQVTTISDKHRTLEHIAIAIWRPKIPDTIISASESDSTISERAHRQDGSVEDGRCNERNFCL